MTVPPPLPLLSHLLHKFVAKVVSRCAERGRAGYYSRVAKGQERCCARQLLERAVLAVPHYRSNRQVCRGSRRQAGDAAVVPKTQMPRIFEAIDCHVFPFTAAASKTPFFKVIV